MKVVYCANCGTCLNIMRKAMPKYAKIIDIVEYHECPDEPVEIELIPVDIPPFDMQKEEGKNKFVQKLDNLLAKPTIETLGTNDLQDKRKPDEVKSDIDSTAPSSVLNQIKSMQNTTPANDINKEPENA